MKRIACIFAVLIAVLAFGAKDCSAQIKVDVTIEKTADDKAKAWIEVTNAQRSSQGAIRLYDFSRTYYMNEFRTNSSGEKEFEIELQAEKEIDGIININGEIRKFSFATDKSFEKGKAKLWIIGYDEVVYSGKNLYTESGESVLQFTQRICEENDIDFIQENGYVSSIGEFAEKEYGIKSGWIYFVDRESPNTSSEAVRTAGGMEIVWAYTTELGDDLENIFEIVDGKMELIRDEELAGYDKLFESMQARGAEAARFNFKNAMDSEKSNQIEEKNSAQKADIVLSFDNRQAAIVTANEAKVAIRSDTFEKNATVDIEEAGDSIYDIEVSGKNKNSSPIYICLEKGLAEFENPFALSCYCVIEGEDGQVKIPTIYDMKTGEFTCRYIGKGKYWVGQAQEKPVYFDISQLSDDDREKVDAVASYGIMSGYPDGSFRADEGVTRAQMAKIICKFEESQGRLKSEETGADGAQEAGKEALFYDVSTGDWFYEYAYYCAQNGWMNGIGNGEFKPNELLTREQTAVILERLDGGKSGINFDIADYHEISPWARDAVCYVIEKGIMKGQGDFKFRPLDNAKRIDIARAVYEMMD